MAQEILNVSQLKVGVEDKEILHGVDLSLNKGETHVLMGPNGAILIGVIVLAVSAGISVKVYCKADLS